MDLNETLDSDYSSGLNIMTEEIKEYLRETAKWAKFIAIVGFVFLGLMVIISVVIGVAFGGLSSGFGGTAMPFPSYLVTFFYLVMAAIGFFPILYLFRFASNMQIALGQNNEAALATSFRNLKSHYKFYGIMMAIVVGFYVLMFVISLVAGVGMAF